MFTDRYFAPQYFHVRYFPRGLAEVATGSSVRFPQVPTADARHAAVDVADARHAAVDVADARHGTVDAPDDRHGAVESGDTWRAYSDEER